MSKIFLLIIVIILQSCAPCIVDMYYAADMDERYKNAIKGSERQCSFTFTECDYNCPTEFIRRKYYDDWAKKYTDLDLEPPHPKRTDVDELLKYEDIIDDLLSFKSAPRKPDYSFAWQSGKF